MLFNFLDLLEATFAIGWFCMGRNGYVRSYREDLWACCLSKLGSNYSEVTCSSVCELRTSHRHRRVWPGPGCKYFTSPCMEQYVE